MKMGKLKYVFRNLNLLNIILIATVVSFAQFVFFPLLNMNTKYNTPSVLKKAVDEKKEEAAAEAKIPPFLEYTVIAEQNLFHPERKIPEIKQELSKPEFVLYGTLIKDDIKLAYIEDRKAPRNTPGRGKRQTVLKLGDTMSGFTLKEIYPDKVVMVRGEENIVIKVIDPDVKKERKVQITPQPEAASPIPKAKKP